MSIARTLRNATRKALGKPESPGPGKHRAEEEETKPTWTAIDGEGAADTVDHGYRGQPSTHDTEGGDSG